MNQTRNIHRKQDKTTVLAGFDITSSTLWWFCSRKPCALLAPNLRNATHRHPSLSWEIPYIPWDFPPFWHLLTSNGWVSRTQIAFSHVFLESVCPEDQLELPNFTLTFGPGSEMPTLRFHQTWRAGKWTIEIHDFPSDRNLHSRTGDYPASHFGWHQKVYTYQ